jgi:hypothetical protein
MAEPIRRRKIFIVRSALYGAAIMINSGAMAFDSESMALVRESIEREFDLA